jgi:hypothetical protein
VPGSRPTIRRSGSARHLYGGEAPLVAKDQAAVEAAMVAHFAGIRTRLARLRNG